MISAQTRRVLDLDRVASSLVPPVVLSGVLLWASILFFSWDAFYGFSNYVDLAPAVLGVELLVVLLLAAMLMMRLRSVSRLVRSGERIPGKVVRAQNAVTLGRRGLVLEVDFVNNGEQEKRIRLVLDDATARRHPHLQSFQIGDTVSVAADTSHAAVVEFFQPRTHPPPPTA